MSEKTVNSFNLENQAYSLSDVLIAVTRHGKNHLIVKGIAKEKISVIYNGIDENLFRKCNVTEVRSKYGIRDNERIILYSGRVDAIKGIKYLIQSFLLLSKRLPDCKLFIVGNGDLEELIQESNKSSLNIRYFGFIPFIDVITLYSIATIGVIPSLEEHCSYVAIEMLHAGLPVVATTVGGLKEIFIHGENALLAETVNDSTNIYGNVPKVQELSNYMYNLLTNETLRSKFSINAKNRAMSLFTADIMINNYLKIVKRVGLLC